MELRMERMIILAVGTLFSMSAFAQQSAGNFSSQEIIKAAKDAIVKDYSANGRTIRLRDIVSRPDYFVVESDNSGRVDLGFHTHYVREAEFGIPDYCNVDLLIKNDDIKTVSVYCSPVD
jgi:hypothetical protein